MVEPTVPPKYVSATGLAFVIDTNIIDDASPDVAALRLLHDEGWINLTRSDTVDTELVKAENEKRDGLLAESSEFVEHLGPMVLDQSRWDHGVWASDEDGDRLTAVAAILYPGIQREALVGKQPS